MRTGRILLASGVACGVLLGGGVAWAFWTGTGSGTGSAAVATTAPELRLHASTNGLLLPGTGVPVRLTADNPSSTGLRVTTVHLAGVTADAAHPGCAVADFSMTDVTVNQTVPPHSSDVALAGTATLDYANTSVDQSACQGATLTLSITSG